MRLSLYAFLSFIACAPAGAALCREPARFIEMGRVEPELSTTEQEYQDILVVPGPTPTPVRCERREAPLEGLPG